MANSAPEILTPLELKLQSHPSNLADARRAIEAFTIKCGFDALAAGDLGLVVNEAIANVMRHAYHGATDKPIVVRAEQMADGLKISIRDWGDGVNPQDLPKRQHDPLTPGGVGMICLQRLMDEVVFTRQADGMLLTMTRRKSRP